MSRARRPLLFVAALAVLAGLVALLVHELTRNEAPEPVAPAARTAEATPAPRALPEPTALAEAQPLAAPVEPAAAPAARPERQPKQPATPRDFAVIVVDAARKPVPAA